ncbi:MAG: cytochrome c [Bacteroidetes bacterium]|nr:cytochrome c [Bacteroidota bacterium]
MFTITPKHIFIALCTLFLIYSSFIYNQPSIHSKNKIFHQKRAGEGKLVWQKYNCQSCHQLYGLGGYLGPDLTNIYSNPQKGEVVIRAMLESGTRQMPSFKLKEDEVLSLLEFLKSADASGRADPREFKVNELGLTEPNEN